MGVWNLGGRHGTRGCTSARPQTHQNCTEGQTSELPQFALFEFWGGIDESFGEGSGQDSGEGPGERRGEASGEGRGEGSGESSCMCAHRGVHRYIS